jgi:hypothetical protein
VYARFEMLKRGDYLKLQLHLGAQNNSDVQIFIVHVRPHLAPYQDPPLSLPPLRDMHSDKDYGH